MKLVPSWSARLLHLLALLLVVRACFLVPAGTVLQTMLAVVMILWLVWMYRRHTGITHVVHDTDGRWWVRMHGHWQAGELASGCFRSRWLMVLAIRSASGERLAVRVWCDTLSPRDVSYLQLQLLLRPVHSLR